ncbi:MAG: DUF4190 domain-containing protein [Vallitalea sp.]|jgi:drug/metabolite transporter (DMT)-like permease|nr:DUF4190 domain-containing protein [Vallitalea sp.]
MTQLDNTNPEVKHKGLAIAAMVCGIVGIVMFCIPYLSITLAILAIVFGAIMVSSNKHNADKTGRGMAIAGIVLGIVTIGLDIFIIAGIVSAFSSFSSIDNFMQ